MNSPQIPKVDNKCLLPHSFDQSIDTAPSSTSYITVFALKAVSQKVFLEGEGNG